MADSAFGREPHYRAFISYSHKDAAFGRRLHRWLEGYALPRRLVGRPGRFGPVPARLSPIFRDREEFSAADDLSAEVREALSRSGCLIVVCSPNAASSIWVNREVETFRSLHPGRPILAALLAGEPRDAFPPALTSHATEPLAADFKPDGDGRRLALLKLASGIVGVRLDELVQRDAQRRLANVTAVTVGAISGMLFTTLLAAFALEARAEAEHQRTKAEGLVEFMLTDLRNELKSVGRLDALTASDAQAFKYYSDQDVRRLSPASLERRARILHALGEDDENRGQLDQALVKFNQAQQATAALLAAEPRNLDRIWAHAQSEFWIGTVFYEKGQRDVAKRHFETYRQLATRLLALDPKNPKSLREVAFAEGALCTMALQPPRDGQVALTACRIAVQRAGEASKAMPGDPQVTADLATHHAWLGDAYREVGDLARAQAERRSQEALLRALLARDPKNGALRLDWAGLQRGYAILAVDRKQFKEAMSRLLAARETLDDLVRLDPQNETWASRKRQNAADIAYVTQQLN